VPACGFQYGLERLDLVAPRDHVDSRRRVLVMGVTADDHPTALRLAHELRSVEGLAVEQDVRLRGVRSALRYADRVGIELVLIVGERERQEGVAVIRDLRTREERRVLAADVLEAVRAAMS
jgi:histidyl-tRNA synthetase